MQVVDINLSPYELVLEEVREGRVDPYDVDVFYLAELFRKTAQELESSEYLREAGRFLEASTKLIKIQIEKIFPRPKPEREKITIKEVREVLVENEDNYELEYDLSWFYDYSPKVGRPTGVRNSKERKLTLNEIITELKNAFHEEVDYKALARQVREKLLKGGKIESLTEFIAYLHAYMEFEDVPDLFQP